MSRKFFFCLSRVFRLILHCPASSRQHKRKPHSNNTLSNQRVKKNLVTYISQNTASCSLFNTYCRVLTSHFSITHCSQLTTRNSLPTIPYSLPIHFLYQRRQRALFHALSPLRPTSPSACDLMGRKFFNCLSRVFRFFIVLLRHIHTTPLQSTCEKKNTTLNSPFLLTTQYAQLINFYPPHNYPILVVHCSQLHIHCYLLATRTHNLLFIAYCSPFATFDLPITTHYSQRTKYNSPRITKKLTIHYPRCSQFTTHSTQRTAHNVQLITHIFFLIIKSLVIDYSLPSSRNSHFTIQNLLPITHFSLFDIH